MKPSEILFLGGLAVFAGITLAGSIRMPLSAGQTFGPGFLPLIMSVAVLVIGALLALRGMRRAGAPLADAPGPETVRGVRLVAAAVALIGATVLAARFGSLLLPLAVCLLVVTSLLLERGWKVGAISTLLTMAAIYAIFDLWLRIPIS